MAKHKERLLPISILVEPGNVSHLDQNMTLSELLSAHESHFESGGIKNNLGDCFLYSCNPIYKNIRDISNAFGFQFVEDKYVFHLPYVISPPSKVILTQLIETEKIPYRDNYPILRSFESSRPGLLKFTEVLSLYIAKNQLLYASSQLIANRMFPIEKPSISGIEGEAALILKKSLHEAFSAANETMSWVYSDSDVHRCLLHANVYSSATIKDDNIVRHGIDQLGFQAAFNLILMSFFYANLDVDFKDFSSNEKKSIREAIISRDLSVTDKTIADHLLSIAGTWSKNSRAAGSSLYSRLLGIKTPNQKLLKDFDFLQEVLNDQDCISGIKILADISELGSKSKYTPNVKQKDLDTFSGLKSKRAA